MAARDLSDNIMLIVSETSDEDNDPTEDINKRQQSNDHSLSSTKPHTKADNRHELASVSIVPSKNGRNVKERTDGTEGTLEVLNVEAGDGASTHPFVSSPGGLALHPSIVLHPPTPPACQRAPGSSITHAPSDMVSMQNKVRLVEEREAKGEQGEGNNDVAETNVVMTRIQTATELLPCQHEKQDEIEHATQDGCPNGEPPHQPQQTPRQQYSHQRQRLTLPAETNTPTTIAFIDDPETDGTNARAPVLTSLLPPASPPPPSPPPSPSVEHEEGLSLLHTGSEYVEAHDKQTAG